MQYRRLQRSALLLLLAAAVVLPQNTHATEINYEAVHCFGGETQAFRYEDHYLAYSMRFTGTVRITKSDSTFGPMFSSQCVGVGAVVDGAPESRGYCEFFDGDGDRLFESFERTGTEGKTRLLSGTGKYEGVTGSGTYVLVNYPRGLAKGTFSNCSEAIETVVLP